MCHFSAQNSVVTLIWWCKISKPISQRMISGTWYLNGKSYYQWNYIVYQDSKKYKSKSQNRLLDQQGKEAGPHLNDLYKLQLSCSLRYQRHLLRYQFRMKDLVKCALLNWISIQWDVQRVPAAQNPSSHGKSRKRSLVQMESSYLQASPVMM